MKDLALIWTSASFGPMGGLEVESDDTFDCVMKFIVGVEIPLLLWVLPGDNKSLPTFPEFMPQNHAMSHSVVKMLFMVSVGKCRLSLKRCAFKVASASCSGARVEVCPWCF